MFNKCVPCPCDQAIRTASIVDTQLRNKRGQGLAYHTIPITSSGINEKIVGNWANYRNRVKRRKIEFQVSRYRGVIILEEEKQGKTWIALIKFQIEL